ncbi:MAG: ATP-binding protein [Thermodesulfobacteriota bacterium]
MSDKKDDIKLLLVDDESDFRQALIRRFGRRGLNPEQAGNGPECLAVLAARPVDVVVMDVKMPGMTGIEVLARIKEKYPCTEVILLTGHASTQDGVDGIKSGAFDYLTKPIEFEHLLSKIGQAYEKILREAEKLKEAEFRAKVEQQMAAAERLASLGTLAVGIAHEINNPLAIIRESAGWLTLLLKRKELSDFPGRKDFELALEKIEKGVDRAKRITHQLLGFVRKQGSAFTQVNLPELADETIELVRKEALDKGIAVELKVEDPVAGIWSDPYQLRQVLLNLLTNAVHATAKGGSITVMLRPLKEGVQLTVRDTGTGIPRENLGHIFDPFFSTKNPGEGTGLGLFVTRGILGRLGGHIEVESSLGQGATFRVWLPQRHEPGIDSVQDDYANILKQIKGEQLP